MVDTFFVIARGQPTEAEDDDVPGTYMLTLPRGYPTERRASAVLDSFHCKIGVSVLDDFSFTVTDADGREIVEPDDAQAYELKGEADFCGKVDPADAGNAPRP